MTFDDPSVNEIKILQMVLKYSCHMNYKTFETRCRSKKIEPLRFIEEFEGVIYVANDGRSNAVGCKDPDYVRRYLSDNGIGLITHHSQKSRRWKDK